ncbi:MAG: DUF1176 domain-containing protein [Bosea sp. (in: a-proteobacteria)]
MLGSKIATSKLVTSKLVTCLIGLLGICAPASAQTPAPKPIPDVDLKLFEKSEVDRSKGCSLALWQANRDPETDRYAYMFTENFTGQNHARQPARMKIGATVVQLTRIATGGKTTGYGLYERQLYKLPGENDFVILDLKLEPEMGEAVEVGGKLTIVMDGFQIFRASVKGGAGCMTPPAAAPPTRQSPAPARRSDAGPAAAPVIAPPVQAAQAKPAAPPTPGPAMFKKYTPRAGQVPKGLWLLAERGFACQPHMQRLGVTGYQMSEESAIWEIPCDSFAYQASSVFALVYLPSPLDNLTFITVPNPPGKTRSGEVGALIDPVWDVKNRVVTSVSRGRAAGDCGVLERYRVTEAGEFELVEYREKEKCDGKVVKPEEFPLVFKAR